MIYKFFVILFVLFISNLYPQAFKNDLNLTLELEKSTYNIDETIYGEIKLLNKSERDIPILDYFFISENGPLQIYCYDSFGNYYNNPVEYLNIIISNSSFILSPDDSMAFVFSLTDYAGIVNNGNSLNRRYFPKGNYKIFTKFCHDPQALVGGDCGLLLSDTIYFSVSNEKTVYNNEDHIYLLNAYKEMNKTADLNTFISNNLKFVKQFPKSVYLSNSYKFIIMGMKNRSKSNYSIANYNEILIESINLFRDDYFFKKYLVHSLLGAKLQDKYPSLTKTNSIKNINIYNNFKEKYTNSLGAKYLDYLAERLYKIDKIKKDRKLK